MSKHIKDTDYLAISARIRAMEGSLLTRERMEQILEARSDEDAAKLLHESAIPSWMPPVRRLWTRPSPPPREAVLEDLAGGAPDPQVYRFIQAEI